MEFLSEVKRTHYCGELREALAGETVVVMGWVQTRRDHGGLIFVDLRDREGIVQVVLDPSDAKNIDSKDIRNEFVLAVQGTIRVRPKGMENGNLGTGQIEIESKRCEILSQADPSPIPIGDDSVSENLRLKYRYLELRSERMQRFLKVRSQVTHLVRSSLLEQGFIEVETPILYKSTPEGARDYLVPSRVHQGAFYALPQSPQTLKQLLMIGGTDKYFQVARCFRDEDLRADRQPEFSQIDIEMSFVDVDDILAVTEALVRTIWKSVKGVVVPEIPRMTYKEAMDRFGSDKPDLRTGMELQNLGEAVKGSGFKVFDDVLDRGDFIKGIAVPDIGNYSRSQMDKLTLLVKQSGGQGLAWIKSDDNGKLNSSMNKFFSPEKLQDIFNIAGGEIKGGVLIVADTYDVVATALSTLRLHLAKKLDLLDTSKDYFLWVTDFPLFDYNAELKRWVAKHHPFTQPTATSMGALLDGQEGKYTELTARAYDLVCNGHELAGGSLRIHRSEVQQAMFGALGMSEEERQAQFGFFLEALNYGTPPHGGIAWGLDRLLMILLGTNAIRDVIAFPKTAKASDLMASAPSSVARDQLLELGLSLKVNRNKEP